MQFCLVNPEAGINTQPHNAFWTHAFFPHFFVFRGTHEAPKLFFLLRANVQCAVCQIGLDDWWKWSVFPMGWPMVTSLDDKQGSGPPKPRCEALCRGLRGTGVVIAVSLMIPWGHQAAPRHIYAFQPYGTLRVVTDYFPSSRGVNVGPRTFIKQKVKAK
jgi:hypothetical protein